ncbi:hypothetical protein [Actinocorallia longicatena]|uniref:Uncharacterized protein n=1 Tax=Actinocorallia longicatena TaxID=111803 RepID=A0ABP6QE32_9ACTN
MLPSVIRTVVPVIVGVLLGWGVRVGLNFDSDALTSIVTVVITGLYFWAGRIIEQYRPGLGRLMLAAGLTRKQPEYKVIPGRVIR